MGEKQNQPFQIRRGKDTQLPLADLLRQSVYSRIAGYEDVNDAERLSQGPIFRLMHYGRYAGHAEDACMQDLFFGYPSLIRGYFGSCMAVGNAEPGAPWFGFLGAVPSRGAPPVEAALFYDAGVAWTPSRLARLLDRLRKPVSSFGASLRFNVFGFAIGQLSYVPANGRPLKPWMWESSQTPGFQAR